MSKVSGKYEPLYSYLCNLIQEKKTLTLSFEDIEQILSFRLPISAYKYNAWWSNEREGHVQAKSWIHAGWNTSNIDLGKKITFIRENHQDN